MVVGAVVVGGGLALAIGGIRGVGATAAEPSTTAEILVSQPTATAAASDGERPTTTPEGDRSPAASAAETAAPDATVTPATTPTPTMVPAAPTAVPTATPAPAPTPIPPNAAELACTDFEFASGDTTVSTLAELEAGIVGSWAGCVTTPWVSPYWVTITFRADGTYSGVALAGSDQPAFYYGTDDDSPEKGYELNDLQDDGEGIGHIDIVFWALNTNRGDLRDIRLMDDQLQFEFFHRGQYGPLTYQLYRTYTDD